MNYPKHLIASTEDADHDRRRAERLAWLDVQEAYRSVARVPLSREFQLAKTRQYAARAVAAWKQAYQELDI